MVNPAIVSTIVSTITSVELNVWRWGFESALLGFSSDFVLGFIFTCLAVLPYLALPDTPDLNLFSQ